MTALDIPTIERLTFEYGQGWALAHVRRVLKLIDQIGAGLEYDRRAMTWAVYLHDWGAFQKYSQAGIEHALRSRQVAETEILPCTDLPENTQAVILEVIELHDYRDTRPVHSNEALLLREADFLDFLGAIGIAREFAKGPKDLQKSHQQILARRQLIEGRFSLPEARKIAAARLAGMDRFFKELQAESFGDL
jgi:uncharacterized protein